MKKFFLSGLVVLSLFIFIGASNIGIPSFLDPASGKSHCTGYTIIEYGKAINCQGDTIALVYPNGFAEASAR